MRIGYKLFAEGYPPKELVRQAVAAEEAGFDFVAISDHFHPWLYDHGHSAFAWSVLAAIAARTERIGLATGVTCPSIRYHPAIVAQAAATTAVLSDGRFVLGVGAGEQLNEHIVGRGWPAVTERHELFREALEIIRSLWSGGYQSYEGKHLKLEDARMFDLPESPIPIAVAIGGPRAREDRRGARRRDLRHRSGSRPRRRLRARGRVGPEVRRGPARLGPGRRGRRTIGPPLFRFGLLSWKVLAELPNPVNFEAAAEFIDGRRRARGLRLRPGRRPPPRGRDGSSPRAGFDHLALVNAGPDPDGFFEFFSAELAEPLRELG